MVDITLANSAARAIPNRPVGRKSSSSRPYAVSRSEAVAAPPDRPHLRASVAQHVLSGLVVLPCYPAIPPGELKRQADVVARATGQKFATQSDANAAVS